MAGIITSTGKGIAIDRTFLAVPTKLSPTQFKVGTGTTAPTIADTDLETAIAIDGGSQFLKDFITGFPTVDLVNNQATTRMFLNTLEANGNDLTEVGCFNEDGSPVMFSRTVFPVVSKTNLIEVTFIEKDLIL